MNTPWVHLDSMNSFRYDGAPVSRARLCLGGCPLLPEQVRRKPCDVRSKILSERRDVYGPHRHPCRSVENRERLVRFASGHSYQEMGMHSARASAEALNEMAQKSEGLSEGIPPCTIHAVGESHGEPGGLDSVHLLQQIVNGPDLRQAAHNTGRVLLLRSCNSLACVCPEPAFAFFDRRVHLLQSKGARTRWPQAWKSSSIKR